ncbi:MAG: YibE/F family protein [Eubacteriaceae bacterium]|nr:YibE/F family protein [Eubacteriaceae bacterium]
MRSTKGRFWVYLTTVIISAALLYAGYLWAGYDPAANPNLSMEEEYLKARVTELVSADIIDYPNGTSETSIVFNCEVLSGAKKGETITASQSVSDQGAFRVKAVEKGDRIILVNSAFQGADSSRNEYFFAEYARADAVFILLGVFAFLVILFGGKKGVSTLISLAFTCLAVIAVLVPAILAGKDIYIATAITCSYMVIMTLVIVNGYSAKTLSAILGCLGGIAVSALICFIMQKVIKLSGYLEEQDYFLVLMNPDIDLKAIVYSSILIGAVGAVMDVAVDISSSLSEISRKIGYVPFSDMFASGIRIGRDIMGTMSNTLVLAYIGSSLCGVLLICSYKTSALNIFNAESIVVELLQAIVGSLGILFAIPVTAAVCSVIYNRKNPRQNSEWFMK